MCNINKLYKIESMAKLGLLQVQNSNYVYL
jgi:hypothetical protein